MCMFWGPRPDYLVLVEIQSTILCNEETEARERRAQTDGLVVCRRQQAEAEGGAAQSAGSTAKEGHSMAKAAWITAALLPGILALSPLVRFDGTSTTALYNSYSSPEPRRDQEVAQNARQFAVAIDVPTITEREPTRAAQIPPRPKIV
ncbi:hypothetical protein THAOC_27478, partial [Thalassiosira oceanica]